MKIQAEGPMEAVTTCIYCGKEIPLGDPRQTYLDNENGKVIVVASMHEACFQKLYGPKQSMNS